MANKKQSKFSGEKIHKFCVDRWEFYKERDGAYLPSKHDKQVFEDASKEFNMPVSACEYWFNKVDKPLAEKKVSEAIANGEFKKLCEEVMIGNGESPWGLQDILGKFYSIISEMKERGIENAYITVSKNEKEYCESGHYLTEVGFSDVITIIQHENGDIGIVDDGNSGYVFELNNIKSIMREITDTDNVMVIPKKMFRLLMRNGNIVTMYFDFKTGNMEEF
ncbi:MAG: hypothetical protein MR384_00830 [Lachnospiraceae bacterium]|nr:hypothetical protein [Lachnospiraceae bacterium]